MSLVRRSGHPSLLGSSRAVARASWLVLAIVAFGGCTFSTLDLSKHACPCLTGWTCDPVQNVCVLDSAACTGASCCVDDTACADPLPRCAPDTHECVACLPESDNCDAGLYCTDARSCAPGCKTNSDCTSPTATLCDRTRHECVQCLQTTDCPGGKFCSPSGACVTGCDPSTPCMAGGMCCLGLCIDTTADYLNCHGCGISCGTGASCCAGTCSALIADPANCGMCGVACASVHGVPACSVGACKWTCDAGWSHCASGNTGCETNVSNNLNRCGSCGNDCTSSIRHATSPVCTNSKCDYGTCSMGYLDCDGSRTNGCETDPTSTTNHCGGCATNCYGQVKNANGDKCVNSVCDYTSCQAGFGDCDGIRTNGCECSCGAVGKICCPGMLCTVSGTCMGDGMCH